MIAKLRSSSVRRLAERPGFPPGLCAGFSRKFSLFPFVLILTSLLLLAPVLLGCDDDDADSPLTQPMGATPTDESTPANSSIPPTEDVVVTIGNLTDLTSVSANAMSYINMSLKDVVGYFNDEDLIPGVELKIETYDEQYDPSKDVPGYKWLKSRGADVIWSAPPPVAPTLKSLTNKDRFPQFAATATMDVLDPPGYTFSLGTIPQYDAYTLLEWIAENDWDYEANGPARIGGAAWSDAYSDAVFGAMSDYAEVYPEQFEVVGFHLIDFTFMWGPQIEDLKDCDYVWLPVPMHIFAKDYRAAGYEAKFLGSDPHAAFMGMIDKGELWDEIDGMLFIRGSQWWTKEGTIIDLTRELVYKNHPDEAESIINTGVGYLAVSQMYQLCNIIRDAAENVGPENVDSTAIYNAAVNYAETIDGIERYSFDENKRFSTNYYVVYAADGERQDLFSAEDEWLPLVTEP